MLDPARSTTQAPTLPQVPWSWYYACELRQLAAGPVRRVIGDRAFAIFRTESGTVSALDARCVHLGADLTRGQVIGECLRCPFHQWSFAADGRCVNIPATPAIPDFAKQAAYPVAVRGPHVFIFNHPQASFEMPFFEGESPDTLLAAEPFDIEADCDWTMISANAFDMQHFRVAHDRTLVDEPVIDSPAPFARRVRANFAVSGTGWRDQITRRISGPRVEMTMTSWCGTIILVRARFSRTTTHGMVCVTPAAPSRLHMRTIVWVQRRTNALARALLDPLDARIRRSFIRAFLRSDQAVADGVRFNRGSLIDADDTMAAYFDWLAGTVRGEGFSNNRGV